MTKIQSKVAVRAVDSNVMVSDCGIAVRWTMTSMVFDKEVEFTASDYIPDDNVGMGTSYMVDSYLRVKAMVAMLVEAMEAA